MVAGLPTVGVPEMIPVVASSRMPAGSVGVIWKEVIRYCFMGSTEVMASPL